MVTGWEEDSLLKQPRRPEQPRKWGVLARGGCNREIYTMTPNGTGLVRLTNDPAWDGQPAWSPDGNRIAFARGGQIYTMNANSGKDLVHLTDNSTRINGEPDWQSLQPGPGVFPPANTNHDRGRVLKRFRDGPSDRVVFRRAVLGGALFILRRGYSEPGLLTAPALLLALIHRSAWKRNSANFAFWGFSELPL
jgi:dipeptidyl aminopeptidase/acylaminoacyl peptidase